MVKITRIPGSLRIVTLAKSSATKHLRAKHPLTGWQLQTPVVNNSGMDDWINKLTVWERIPNA